MIKLTRSFARFWYDFIVGDSIVLAIGAPAVLGLAYLFSHSGSATAAQVLLPIAVIATLALSLAWRADA